MSEGIFYIAVQLRWLRAYVSGTRYKRRSNQYYLNATIHNIGGVFMLLSLNKSH